MTLGKSIRIYLKDGSISGVKQAEVVNHTIQALSSFRNTLSELNACFSKEANRPGVYFLIGEDSSSFNKVYIGEAENVWERLKSHDIKKDFWNEVILYTSKDENLTKSHVKYLESRLVNIASGAGRYKVENNNTPTLSSLPMADKDSMEDFILYVKILTGTLGHKFLENPVSSVLTPTNGSNLLLSGSTEINSIRELTLSSAGIKATAIQTKEGLVVLENSMVSLTHSPSSYTALREKLLQESIIEKNSAGELRFMKKYLFESPSAAGAVILGYNVNGRRIWKDSEGRTLKKLEELQVEQQAISGSV